MVIHFDKFNHGLWTTHDDEMKCTEFQTLSSTLSNALWIATLFSSRVGGRAATSGAILIVTHSHTLAIFRPTQLLGDGLHLLWFRSSGRCGRLLAHDGWLGFAFGPVSGRFARIALCLCRCRLVGDDDLHSLTHS